MYVCWDGSMVVMTVDLMAGCWAGRMVVTRVGSTDGSTVVRRAGSRAVNWVD